MTVGRSVLARKSTCGCNHECRDECPWREGGIGADHHGGRRVHRHRRHGRGGHLFHPRRRGADGGQRDVARPRDRGGGGALFHPFLFPARRHPPPCPPRPAIL